MNSWAKAQVEAVEALNGQVIEAWVGVEMAVRSNEDQTDFAFSDPAVPCLQLYELTAQAADGSRTRFVNYENDGEWGLQLILDAEPSRELLAPGFRLRALDELPVGQAVVVGPRYSEQGDLSEIELTLGGKFLLLVAGETHEETGPEETGPEGTGPEDGWDPEFEEETGEKVVDGADTEASQSEQPEPSRIDFHRHDESVLVFHRQADYDSVSWIPPQRPAPESSNS